MLQYSFYKYKNIPGDALITYTSLILYTWKNRGKKIFFSFFFLKHWNFVSLGVLLKVVNSSQVCNIFKSRTWNAEIYIWIVANNHWVFSIYFAFCAIDVFIKFWAGNFNGIPNSSNGITSKKKIKNKCRNCIFSSPFWCFIAVKYVIIDELIWTKSF